MLTRKIPLAIIMLVAAALITALAFWAGSATAEPPSGPGANVGDATQRANPGRPAIGHSTAEPHRWPPTGCFVLWNDRHKIADYLAQKYEPDWRMPPSSEIFDGDEVREYHHWSMRLSTPLVRETHIESGNRDDYDGWYAVWVNSLISKRLWGAPLGWGQPKNTNLYQFQNRNEWDTGHYGYGDQWRWWYGIIVQHHQALLGLDCYHIAAGSHGDQPEERRLLPVAPEEPPTTEPTQPAATTQPTPQPPQPTATTQPTPEPAQPTRLPEPTDWRRGF